MGYTSDWIDTILPRNAVSLVGGPSQAGKTTLLAWILKQVQEGNVVLGRTTTSCLSDIYYITADQPWDDYQRILDKVGLKIQGYYSYSDDPSMTYEFFSKQPGIKLLGAGLSKVDPPPHSIVVVDVLGLFFDSIIDYRQTLAAMWEYVRWAKKRQITLIGTVHAGKVKSHDRYIRLFDRIMGGNPMRAASSSVMYLTSQEESSVKGSQEFEIVPRHGKIERWLCAWNEKGLLLPVEKVEVVAGRAAKEEVAEAGSSTPPEAYKLLAWVPYEDPGISTGDWQAIAMHELAISRATFFRWKGRLEEELRVLPGGRKGTFIRQKED